MKRRGDDNVRRMIDRGLENTSVTAVLIGLETADRPWVRYEIEKSYDRGNGLVGIYINGIEDRNRLSDPRGRNPFDVLGTNRNGSWIRLSQLGYRSYDWVLNEGYRNLPLWVEEAARQAGR